MAAFTASTTGNWNDGATWGNTSPGVKGTDWPGNAGDTVTIGSGKTVTYNVSETNELGAISITGLLTFSTTANTKLTLGNSTITINNGGELRVGASGSVIGSSYTAEIYWNTTSDNANGITVNDGGKLTVYGDPAYYGSDYDTTLQANWTTGQTFTVVGDFTSKWAANQILIVHKGAAFSNINTDVALVTIASVAANSGNTNVTINEAFPTGTFNSGGIVLNVSRNVMIGKLSATTTVGNNNTNRPRILDSNTGYGKLNISDCLLTGLFRIAGGQDIALSSSVIRNSNIGLSGFKNISFSGATYSMSTCVNICTGGSVSAYILNSVSGFVGSSVLFSGHAYANTTAFSTNYSIKCSGYVYGNATGFLSAVDSVIGGSVGYNASGTAVDNTNDFRFAASGGGMSAVLLGSKTKTPPTFTGQFSSNGDTAYVAIGDYGQTMGSHYMFQVCGDVIKNTSTIRTGGGASSIEVIPNSSCTTNSGLVRAFEWTEFGVAASAQTKSVYMLGSGWSTWPTASELWFEAEYLSHATLPTKTVVKSTAVLTDNTTWTEFSVTFTPSQAGIVRYRAYLGKYAASCKVFIDNQLTSA